VQTVRNPQRAEQRRPAVGGPRKAAGRPGRAGGGGGSTAIPEAGRGHALAPPRQSTASPAAADPGAEEARTSAPGYLTGRKNPPPALQLRRRLVRVPLLRAVIGWRLPALGVIGRREVAAFSVRR